MKIKVCGLKYPDNINAVANLVPDYVGFICYDRSPRFVGDIAADTLKSLPASIYKTGVFVNESRQEINRLAANLGFNAIQLHGDEDPDFANSFRNKVQVIKAFGVNPDFDFNQLNDYANKVDYFLFDTKTAEYGGSGKAFDWSVLNKYNLNVPFFLSGGLSLDNLAQLAKITHPQFYGVDLNSRFEIAPGNKDLEKLKQAFSLIKQYTTHEIRS
ncbi:phosphoribosylanthranilate isomerase [Mucilaginibacter sp. UR6-11]|uniref:phosphoribosylanthranilate isomerase n=1 Tax=Mucilaginibacter sp. UR6-11 TaxID=1435644 RepID=UPI001E375873|nr:phosphoribosylanthranilate isomerase [Mucilaginibacter sp. UR6-11]MCC8425972.1 phosphoribosylanthranilate isomerase [Mucilaginibacter sp. UR6-11]